MKIYRTMWVYAVKENERGDFYSGVAKHVTDSSARQPAQLKATAVTLKPRGDMIDPEEQRKRDLRELDGLN